MNMAFPPALAKSNKGHRPLKDHNMTIKSTATERTKYCLELIDQNN